MDFIRNLWSHASELPAHTWNWFNTLNREEWLVTLAVVCALGFLSLTGMRSHRL